MNGVRLNECNRNDIICDVLYDSGCMGMSLFHTDVYLWRTRMSPSTILFDNFCFSFAFS